MVPKYLTFLTRNGAAEEPSLPCLGTNPKSTYTFLVC